MPTRDSHMATFAGFLIAWGYWISIWASLPVIAVALAGASSTCSRMLRSRAIVVCLTLGAIWVVVLINLRGVKAAGLMAEVTTYAKLVPFGCGRLDRAALHRPVAFQRVQSERRAIAGRPCAALAPLTMFAFLGLESATVPAGDVRDPERTIPRSTVLGIGDRCAALRAGTIVVMGVRAAGAAGRIRSLRSPDAAH